MKRPKCSNGNLQFSTDLRGTTSEGPSTTLHRTAKIRENWCVMTGQIQSQGSIPVQGMKRFVIKIRANATESVMRTGHPPEYALMETLLLTTAATSVIFPSSHVMTDLTPLAPATLSASALGRQRGARAV